MPRNGKCAVTIAYEQMDEGDKGAFRHIIVSPALTNGYIARLLDMSGYHGVDRAAVGHYRRKLSSGKATL